MITFTSASRELKPASMRAPALPLESGISAWFVEAPRRRLVANSQSGVNAAGIHAGSVCTDLDRLVADIATLTRSYLNRDEPGPTPSALEFGESAFNDAPAAARKTVEFDASSPAEDDELGVLDAVCNLLGSALQRMRTAASGQATEIVMSTASSRPRGGIAPSALRRVREHIDSNLGEHIDIADLANITGLSPCHFSRAFKQSMGMPPHRYLISRRVREAARLIESTDRPMFEIALDVGFSDQSHFTRVFSSQVGESPSQYRHQRR
jgi:AraC-like DNA-binding protein